MSLFCLLCIPLLYLLRRQPSDGERSSFGGLGVWALPLGIAAVLVRFIFGPLVTPGEFGFSRWMSGFVDIVGLPALFPLITCGALVMLRLLPRNVNYASFALLWLAPLAAVLPISNASSSPIPLILVPLLWSAQALGVPFFIDGMVKNPRQHIVFFATLGIAALPIAAVSAWWAFFAQRTLLGIGLLVVSLVPAAISLRVGLTPQRPKSMEYLDILDY